MWSEDSVGVYDFASWLKPKTAAEAEAEVNAAAWDEVWGMLAGESGDSPELPE